nr:aldolase/citrate lyase family protein [Arenicellales bacterium]
MILRPRRSALFMPGDNPRAQQKATGLPADVIILDLEDAVSPANKEAARQQVQSTLEQTDYGQREVVVRVNRLETQSCKEDLKALASNPPDAILLPKVESADELFSATVTLNALGAPSDLAVWAMIETPLGIQHIEEIVAATPRLACVVAGTADLASALRI